MLLENAITIFSFDWLLVSKLLFLSLLPLHVVVLKLTLSLFLHRIYPFFQA
jgi:hypothetical protein